MIKPLRIFLCHASSDKPSVRALHRRLTADGFAPWLDEVELLPGQEWDREIQNAIRTSDIVVVCLSEDSTTRRGYVQKEISVVLDAAEEMPEDAIFLIPARLEDCTVPARLRRWQWVDLFVDEGYQRLRRSLDPRRGATGTQRQDVPREVALDNESVRADPEQSVTVRFDGMYTQAAEDLTRVVRFVAPDTALAISVSTDDPPASLVPRIARWLIPGDEEHGEGRFQIDGESIRWDDISMSGTVLYRGTISAAGTELHLHTRSLINGHESYGVWRFVPLDARAEPPELSSSQSAS